MIDRLSIQNHRKTDPLIQVSDFLSPGQLFGFVQLIPGLRIEFNLGENLERTPSDVMVDQRPVLDLKGRELTLSIDSRGDKDSVFYLDDLTLAVNPEPKAN